LSLLYLQEADTYSVIYESATFKINAPFIKEVMKIFISETEPLRGLKGFAGALPMQMISKDEISKFSKNGGNALGVSEGDGSLLCTPSFTAVWGTYADLWI
jgi:hypothetical protein